MCGLAGLFASDPHEPCSPERLESMIAAIRHRGPDGEGRFLAPGLALGHARLAIVDLASGSQPMSDADERITVVYNGMIYNFMELRAELETKGHHFRTRGVGPG